MTSMKGCLEAMPIKQTSLTYKEQKKQQQKNTKLIIHNSYTIYQYNTINNMYFNTDKKCYKAVETSDSFL